MQDWSPWTLDAIQLAHSWITSKGTWLYNERNARKVGGGYDILHLPVAGNDNGRR